MKTFEGGPERTASRAAEWTVPISLKFRDDFGQWQRIFSRLSCLNTGLRFCAFVKSFVLCLAVRKRDPRCRIVQ